MMLRGIQVELMVGLYDMEFVFIDEAYDVIVQMASIFASWDDNLDGMRFRDRGKV